MNIRLIYCIALIITLIAMGVCALATKNKQSRLAKLLRRLLLMASFTMLFNGLAVLLESRMGVMVAQAGFAICIDWVLALFVLYTLEYTELSNIHPMWYGLIYFLCSLDTVSLIVNIFKEHMFSLEYKHYTFADMDVWTLANPTFFYQLHLILSYVLAIIVFVLLIRKIILSASFYRKKYSLIFIGFLLLLIIDGAAIAIQSAFNISIFFYCVVAIVVTYLSLSYIPRNLISNMLSLVVEDLNNTVVCFDPSGNVIYMNSIAEQMMKNNTDKYYLEKKYRAWKLAYGDSPERTVKWTEEADYFGTKLSFEVVVQKLYDEKDHYLGVYFTSYNRTEEVNAHNAKLKEAELAAERSSRFWANISHEMRTPMNAIFGMNEMILRESTDSQITEYSQNIRTAAEMMLNLVNDVLDFSKIDSGKMAIVPKEYDVMHMIKNLNVLLKEKAKEKGLEFKVELDNYLPTKLLGDELRMQQIITNLGTNAIKYTEQGTVTLRIFGEHRFEEFFLHVEVEDTGIGIRKESIPLLFEAYERIDEARVHGIQGTGLGINICQHLLEQMGSKLEVESEIGKGSRFFFTVNQPIMETNYVEGTDSLDAEESEGLTDSTDFSQLNILFVDDNDMNRSVFKALLKKTKANLEVYDNGFDAIAASRQKKYDLIFLDHLMPDISGDQVFTQMKEDEQNLNLDTPMVMMTANAVDGIREHFIEFGFQDFLAKPVDPRKLEELIIRWTK